VFLSRAQVSYCVSNSTYFPGLTGGQRERERVVVTDPLSPTARGVSYWITYFDKNSITFEALSLKISPLKKIGYGRPLTHACNPSYLEAEIRRIKI
jgi:hypothetical protein